MSLLAELPLELLNSILEHSDWSSIVVMRTVSRMFRTIVDTSPALQYKISLAIAGFKDGTNRMTPIKNLQSLIAHQDAWKNMQKSSEDVIPRMDGELWELYSGVLAQTDVGQNFLFYRLNSPLRSIPYQQWSIKSPEFPVRDFGMDYSQNILILLESPVWLPAHLLNKNYRIHLRKLSDGSPHPEARVSVIQLQQDRRDPSTMCNLQISGDYLGVLFTSHDRSSKKKLGIWNWKSGDLMLHVDDSHIESFVFFSQRHVILTQTLINGSRVSLKVLDFVAAGPNKKSLPEAHPSWVFLLPALSANALLHGASIRCDPAPGWRPSEPEAPFHMAGGERLFAVTLDATISYSVRCVKALLFLQSGLANFLQNHAEATTTPWDKWGPQNARILDLMYGQSDTWVCFTHGTKFVYPRTEIIDPVSRPNLFLDVYDFNQLAAKREDSSSEEPEPQNFAGAQDLFQESARTTLPYRRMSLSITEYRGELESWMCSQDNIILVCQDEFRVLNF